MSTRVTETVYLHMTFTAIRYVAAVIDDVCANGNPGENNEAKNA